MGHDSPNANSKSFADRHPTFGFPPNPISRTGRSIFDDEICSEHVYVGEVIESTEDLYPL